VGGDTQGDFAYCGFKSYDQGRARFQADTLDIVWLDEEPDEDLYYEALTRISTTNGIVMMTFTPLKGVSKIVRRYMQDKPRGTHITRMAIEDAAHFTPEKIAELVARYPAHEREARLQGVPKLGSGAVFPVPESQIMVPRFKIPEHFAQINGMDFGWDHPTAAVNLAVDREQKKVYITRCHRVRETTPIVFAASVKHWGEWIPWSWPHDGHRHESMGIQVARLYAEQGMKMLNTHAQFTDGTNNVEAGILGMLDAFLTGRLMVFEDLREWIDEYRMYHRVEGVIVKEEDDLMAATRYAWMMLRYAVTRPVQYKARHGERGRSFRTV
jgi:phage terminase large subunit-like protein